MDSKEVARHPATTDDKTSRYRSLDRIRYSTGEEVIETPDRVYIPQSTQDQFHQVGVGEEGRLDLIAYKYYGNPLYWWGIAYASNIYDPFSIKVGDMLRIPPLTNIVNAKGVKR